MRQKERKPMNVILFISDQHRADCMGCAGHQQVRTPNLDRFAASGIHVTNMFSPYPLCGPARASIMTGQYPQAHMARFNGVPVPMNNPRLPRTLQGRGYHTGTVGIIDFEPRKGKYHGWDEYVYKSGYDAWAKERGIDDPGAWSHARKGHDYGALDQPAELHFSSWVAEAATELMERWQDSSQPFFLRVGDRIPHPPYNVPRPYDTMYDPDAIVLDAAVDPKRQDYDSLKQATAYYYGLCSLMDYNFGRVLDKIEELGIADNTIVLYISDHGNLLGHHDLFGKVFFYDGDAHVPCILRYPGQPAAGMLFDELVEQIDVMPTILDLLQIPVPRGVQGTSCIPAIEGREPGKDAVFGHICCEWRDKRQMVRTKDWKLIHCLENESMLFDLNNDPHEQNNLYGNEQYRQIELDLKERLLRWHLETENRTVPSLFFDDKEETAQWVKDWMDPVVASGQRSDPS